MKWTGMKRTGQWSLISAAGLLALGFGGCGPSEEGLEPLAAVSPNTSSAALTVYQQAAVDTANTSQHCDTLGNFHWELGDGATVHFSLSRGTGVGAFTEMPLASASKWLYASAYLQSKGYANLTPNEKRRLNFTSGYLEGIDATCGDPGTTVSACYGPSYKNVSYNASQEGKYYYDGGHMQKLAADDIGIRSGTGFASVMDWVNKWLSTSLPESDNAVSVAGGFHGSAAHYRLFLQKLLNNQYAMSSQLVSDAVPAYAGGPGVAFTPWSSSQRAFYGLGHWLEREWLNGAWTLTGHSSPGKFGFYPWVDAGKTQYMILARSRVLLANNEGEKSRLCAHAIRRAYLTGVPEP
ncbi:hypothetical protein [Hyalangium rubrum]|uniref:Serine hydrolase n=1 Tax=Hyalangium rubrum TaxID=3103134 RepID=A0ABU5H8P1_9BACT|nr:hypothetical protein [Hyalangium sp. s54d21]MDY7229606.1 hypothetical protein [Hyalangium sp. s54d21]